MFRCQPCLESTLKFPVLQHGWGGGFFPYLGSEHQHGTDFPAAPLARQMPVEVLQQMYVTDEWCFPRVADRPAFKGSLDGTSEMA